MNHKELAMKADKRMKTSKRKDMTVKTWEKHMRAVIAGAK